jgi:microcystin-dependent protein
MRVDISLDIPIPRWVKRVVSVAVVPAALVTAITVVRADVPHAFKDGDTLSAAALNDDFNALDARIKVLEAAAAQVPVGTIVAYGGDVAPAGWLLCDGAEVSRVQYAALFAAIKVYWGQGNNADTFNVPDLRGRFLRGVDHGAGVDPDAASRGAIKLGGDTGDKVGSAQDDDLKSHNHTMGSYSNINQGAGFLPANGTLYGAYATSNTGGAETRPKNAYVNWIIKY